MTMKSNLNDLSTRIATEFNTVRDEIDLKLALTGGTLSGALTIDEGLGLGNIVIDPITVNAVFDNQMGENLEVNAQGFFVANLGTDARTVVTAGSVSAWSSTGVPAMATLDEELVTKAYVDSAIAAAIAAL